MKHLLLKCLEMNLSVYQEDTSEHRVDVKLRLQLDSLFGHALFSFSFTYCHSHDHLGTIAVIINYK